MRNYEIVFLLHPDKSGQLNAILDSYKLLIEENGGSISRVEDWGRRQLAYPIQKLRKAHYVLMNITCSQPTLDELQHKFRFQDDILRHLVERVETAVPQSEQSVMMKNKEKPTSHTKVKSKASSVSEQSKETEALTERTVIIEKTTVIETDEEA